MTPTFWKLSQSPDYFSYKEFMESIEQKLVYVHSQTGAKGGSERTQAQHFVEAPIGDYFYLTFGNHGIYLIGQFIGPANLFLEEGEGWLDRPFRLIKYSETFEHYSGTEKWWTPNHLSTFAKVGDDELGLFEELILRPFFKIKLSDYGVSAK